MASPDVGTQLWHGLHADDVVVNCPPSEWNTDNEVPRQLALQWASNGEIKAEFKLDPNDCWDCCLAALPKGHFDMIYGHSQLSKASGPDDFYTWGNTKVYTHRAVINENARDVTYLIFHDLFCFQTAVRAMVDGDRHDDKEWFDFVVGRCQMYTLRGYYKFGVEYAHKSNKDTTALEEWLKAC